MILWILGGLARLTVGRSVGTVSFRFLTDLVSNELLEEVLDWRSVDEIELRLAHRAVDRRHKRRGVLRARDDVCTHPTVRRELMWGPGWMHARGSWRREGERAPSQTTARRGRGRDPALQAEDTLQEGVDEDLACVQRPGDG